MSEQFRIGPNGPTQAPLEWHKPVIIEIEGEEREAILRNERAEQAAAGCAIVGNGEFSPEYLYDHAAFKARLAGEPASGGYPPGFADWPLEHRNKWFGANTAALLADSDHLVGRRPEDSAEPFILPSLGPEAPIARVTDAATFLRAYAPISYTIEGVLPSGYLYGITARQGGGKTAFMIAASMAVVLGDATIIGCEVEQGRVAYVTIENPADFRMKLAVNCYAHGVSYDAIAPLLAIIDGRDPPEAIVEGLRLDAEVNGPFQLVCFDTFQAGFATAGGVEFNDNAAVLKFLLGLRPITVLPGSPSALIAFHPTKNAGEESLVPYGGGSIMNEVDGNLTIWVEAPYQLKFHWNRVRGPEFEPRYFRIEKLSCPEIVDKQGRQILMPVLWPTTAQAVEEREAVESKTDIALLRALLANPGASQRELAQAIGLSSVSSVNKKIQKLLKSKMLELSLNGLVVAERAKKQLNSTT